MYYLLFIIILIKYIQEIILNKFIDNNVSRNIIFALILLLIFLFRLKKKKHFAKFSKIMLHKTIKSIMPIIILIITCNVIMRKNSRCHWGSSYVSFKQQIKDNISPTEMKNKIFASSYRKVKFNYSIRWKSYFSVQLCHIYSFNIKNK